jgi:hypothetical protein
MKLKMSAVMVIPHLERLKSDSLRAQNGYVPRQRIVMRRNPPNKNQ